MRIFCLLCVIMPLLAKQADKKWETSTLIWNAGIIALCDKGVDLDPRRFYKYEGLGQLEKERYRNIQRGQTVWVEPKMVLQFFQEIFPETLEPFVLVVSGADESFPSQTGLSLREFEELLESDRLIHVFAQNCDYQGFHKKLTPIPIGIDYHTVAYKGSGWGERGSPSHQERQLLSIFNSSLPTHLRKKRAFVDFHHFDSIRKGYLNRYVELGEDRTAIFKQVMKTGLVDIGPKMRRSALWKTKSQYAFSISPHGNGLDCHRTWEDLALGCIVIVKTSPLDQLYKGLPVVIVKDWSEITEDNLDKWLELFQDASYREKLSLKYWLEKISASREMIEFDEEYMVYQTDKKR